MALILVLQKIRSKPTFFLSNVEMTLFINSIYNAVRAEICRVLQRDIFTTKLDKYGINCSAK